MNDFNTCAVLTGDIVASQQLKATELARVRAVIQDASEHISLWSVDLLPYPTEFSRGDAWQLLLRDPAMALRASLWIRSALLSCCDVDTRIAIGLGEASTLAETLSQSSGSAFVRSGQMLDTMSRERLAIVLPPSSEIASWVALTARLCDTLVGSWTQRQAELVHAVLPPQSPTQTVIAAKLSPPVSKQAVGKGLRAAHWGALSQALDVFEGTHWS